MNLNRILFATDFSERDREAFRSSCKLALDWNATLNIVHVQDPRDTAKPAAERTLPSRDFVRFIPANLDIKYTQHVLTGNAANEILKFAEKNSVALIVLGTHGRDGIQRFFSGSVAERIMRKAKCAVMTRRAGDAFSPSSESERILVPVDFSVYGYAAVDFASRMAITTSAELTICYVDDSDFAATCPLPHDRLGEFEHKSDLWRQLCGFQPTNSKVIFSHMKLSGDPGKEICDYANSDRYDFIVIGTHGRTGLARVVMGSVAEYVVRHSSCPVISVKPSNERDRPSVR